MLNKWILNPEYMYTGYLWIEFYEKLNWNEQLSILHDSLLNLVWQPHTDAMKNRKIPKLKLVEMVIKHFMRVSFSHHSKTIKSKVNFWLQQHSQHSALILFPGIVDFLFDHMIITMYFTFPIYNIIVRKTYNINKLVAIAQLKLEPEHVTTCIEY